MNIRKGRKAIVTDSPQKLRTHFFKKNEEVEFIGVDTDWNLLIFRNKEGLEQSLEESEFTLLEEEDRGILELRRLAENDIPDVSLVDKKTGDSVFQAEMHLADIGGKEANINKSPRKYSIDRSDLEDSFYEDMIKLANDNKSYKIEFKENKHNGELVSGEFRIFLEKEKLLFIEVSHED